MSIDQKPYWEEVYKANVHAKLDGLKKKQLNLIFQII